MHDPLLILVVFLIIVCVCMMIGAAVALFNKLY